MQPRCLQLDAADAVERDDPGRVPDDAALDDQPAVLDPVREAAPLQHDDDETEAGEHQQPRDDVRRAPGERDDEDRQDARADHPPSEHHDRERVQPALHAPSSIPARRASSSTSPSATCGVESPGISVPPFADTVRQFGHEPERPFQRATLRIDGLHARVGDNLPRPPEPSARHVEPEVGDLVAEAAVREPRLDDGADAQQRRDAECPRARR